MSSTIKDLAPVIVSAGLEGLYNRLNLLNLITNDFSTDLAERGDRVKIPIIDSEPAQKVDETKVIPKETPSAVLLKTVELVLEHWYESLFHLNVRELSALENKSQFILDVLKAKGAALGDIIEAKILEGYQDVYNFMGDPSTELLSQNKSFSQFLSDVGFVLEAKKVPTYLGRSLVLNTKDYYKGLADQKLLEVLGQRKEEIFNASQLPSLYQFQISTGHLLPVHTVGTAWKSGISFSARFQKDSSEITLNGLSGTSKVNRGDIFYIGNKQDSYVVKSAINSTSTTNQKVQIAPNLRKTVNSGTAVNFLGSHSVNLAFGKGAIGFAGRVVRKLQASHIEMVQVDTRTGLPLRFTQFDTSQNFTQYTYDLLFGTRVLDPERIVRIVSPVPA